MWPYHHCMSSQFHIHVTVLETTQPSLNESHNRGGQPSMWCGCNKWKGCHTWASSSWVCHWIWLNTMLLCDLVFDIVVKVDDVVTSWESITSWLDRGIQVVGSFLVMGGADGVQLRPMYSNLLEQQSRILISWRWWRVCFNGCQYQLQFHPSTACLM